MAYRVLIVDDSEIIRAVIKKSLLISGFDVGAFFEASDGEDALQTLKHQWVDVVFVDINMPKMRGDELIAKLRRDEVTAALPIIVISSIRSQAMRDEMAKLGVNGYIAKPFYPEKLRETVATALGIREDA